MYHRYMDNEGFDTFMNSLFRRYPNEFMTYNELSLHPNWAAGLDEVVADSERLFLKFAELCDEVSRDLGYNEIRYLLAESVFLKTQDPTFDYVQHRTEDEEGCNIGCYEKTQDRRVKEESR
ncbi:MAG: hypothetical protein NVSMB66_6890 [Candidatus Doudnabacteria bacterium]